MYLLLGRKKGRLLIGSGNATLGGLFRNAELFGLFEFSSEDGAGPHKAFAESVNFIKSLAKSAPPIVQTQFAKAESWTPWLQKSPADDGRVVLFGGPGRKPLLEQIRERLGPQPIDTVVVCTASFDRRLQGLQELATLTKSSAIHCIVQPSTVKIDGKAVRRLGHAVRWHPFSLRFSGEPDGRDTSRNHSKFMIFQRKDSEVAVFGSANASWPALGGGTPNVEIVVMLPECPRGAMLKKLGLAKSLGKDIRHALMEHEWTEDDEAEARQEYDCMVGGATVQQDHIELHVLSGTPPRGCKLEVCEDINARPLTVVPLASKDRLTAPVREIPLEQARLVRVARSDGTPASNFIAITWPDVVISRDAAAVNQRTEEALTALRCGHASGAILLGLLDVIQGFELQDETGSRRTPGNGEPELNGTEHPDRTPESFYTDRVGDGRAEVYWAGDRVDLDLLASFCHPIPLPHAPGDDEADDQESKRLLREEEQRREPDTGEDSPDATLGRSSITPPWA
jgi:hypothetical protein